MPQTLKTTPKLLSCFGAFKLSRLILPTLLISASAISALAWGDPALSVNATLGAGS